MTFTKLIRNKNINFINLLNNNMNYIVPSNNIHYKPLLINKKSKIIKKLNQNYINQFKNQINIKEIIKLNLIEKIFLKTNIIYFNKNMILKFFINSNIKFNISIFDDKHNVIYVIKMHNYINGNILYTKIKLNNLLFIKEFRYNNIQDNIIHSIKLLIYSINFIKLIDKKNILIHSGNISNVIDNKNTLYNYHTILPYYNFEILPYHNFEIKKHDIKIKQKLYNYNFIIIKINKNLQDNNLLKLFKYIGNKLLIFFKYLWNKLINVIYIFIKKIFLLLLIFIFIIYSINMLINKTSYIINKL